MTYQSIGLGGGITAIKAQTVDFGITDAPLKPRDLQKGALGSSPWSWAKLFLSSIWKASTRGNPLHRAATCRHLPGKGEELG